MNAHRKNLPQELAELVDEVRRELGIRRIIYRREVDAGNLDPMAASRQFGRMHRVLKLLVAISNDHLAMKQFEDALRETEKAPTAEQTPEPLKTAQSG